MKRLGVFIATSAGAGFFPFAPGTIGSGVGVIIYWLTRSWNASWQAGLLLGISVVGIWASGVAARYFNREDPSHVVIDEVAGQLLTVFLLNVGITGATIGFFIFRILDITKPWPARRFEDLPGGVGIMADDLMAGAYGWLLLWGLLKVAPALR
jgi:phosphatidylglycerophosphatase A